MAVKSGKKTASIGKDNRIKLMGPDGAEVQLNNVVNFKSTPIYDDLEVTVLDGDTIYGAMVKGYDLSFEVVRDGPGLNKFFAGLDELWFEEGTLAECTAFAFIKEADGTNTILKYEGVALKFDDAGSWEPNKEVRQSVSGKATRQEVK